MYRPHVILRRHTSASIVGTKLYTDKYTSKNKRLRYIFFEIRWTPSQNRHRSRPVFRPSALRPTITCYIVCVHCNYWFAWRFQSILRRYIIRSAPRFKPRLDTRQWHSAIAWYSYGSQQPVPLQSRIRRHVNRHGRQEAIPASDIWRPSSRSRYTSAYLITQQLPTLIWILYRCKFSWNYLMVKILFYEDFWSSFAIQ